MERRNIWVYLMSLALFGLVHCNETSEFNQTVDAYDNCYRGCDSTTSPPVENLLCRCDSSCAIYGDCCHMTNENIDSSPLEGLLECRSVHLDERQQPGWKESFWMVSACPPQWLDDRDDPLAPIIFSNCSSGSDDLPPVTDLRTGMAYKNEYCAVCHGVSNFTQWGYTLACRENFEEIASAPGFQFTFDNLLTYCRTCGYREPSSPSSTARPCFHPSLVNEDCLDRDTLAMKSGEPISESSYQNIVDQCRNGPISPLRNPSSGTPYRNQYCALCDGVSVSREEMSCVDPYNVRDTTNYCQYIEIPTTEATVMTTTPTEEVTTEPPLPAGLLPGPLGKPGIPISSDSFFFTTEDTFFEAPPSFTVFLDVNRNTQTVTVKTETVTDQVVFNVSQSCETGQVFDLVLEECRKTVCQEVAMGESCQISGPITINNVTVNVSSICGNGSAIYLNHSEFTPVNNKTLQYGGEVYDIIGFTNDELPVICVHFTQNVTVEVNGTEERNVTDLLYTYPTDFSVLTYVGCSLSVIGCTIVLLTYALFKELRTLPGKILMNLCAAILATTVFLLLGIPLFSLSEKEELCHTTAILLHWLVLSEFSWMIVMSFELARTMIRANQLKPSDTERTKLKIFLIYLLIGWGLPTLVTTVSIILNYSTEYIQYGENGFCWIGDRNSFYAVFVAPLVLSLVVNGIAFFVTTYLLIKAQRNQAKLQKENSTSYLRIHVSVFSITGLTWIFGIIAILVQQDWAWYIFIILNATQGFTICAAFLFTKKVFRLYREMFWPKISSKLSFMQSLKKNTIDTSMATHYIRKSEKVTITSTVTGSVMDPSPDLGLTAPSTTEEQITIEKDPARYVNARDIEEQITTEKDPVRYVNTRDIEENL